jgi:hypothetical protein
MYNRRFLEFLLEAISDACPKGSRQEKQEGGRPEEGYEGCKKACRQIAGECKARQSREACRAQGGWGALRRGQADLEQENFQEEGSGKGNGCQTRDGKKLCGGSGEQKKGGHPACRTLIEPAHRAASRV